MESPNAFRAVLIASLSMPWAMACEDEPAVAPDPTAPATADPAPSPGTEVAEGESEAPQEPAAVPDEAYGTYEVDPVHSSVVFAAGHFGVGTVYGMFNDVRGTYTMAEDLSDSSVRLEIGADSIFSGNRQRDDDLKGPDFLHAGQFPEITFESREVRRVDAGFEVRGDLTLRGRTQPATIAMTYVGAGTVPLDDSYRTGFEGAVTIDRTDFGIEAMPGAVGQELRLIPAIEGIRQ